MTQSSKLDRYVQQMADAGVGKSTAFPPLWRVLWRIGIQAPPPIFLGFLPLTLIFGGSFGVIFSGVAWLFQDFGMLRQPAMSPPLFALLAGIPYGLAMAYYHRGLAKQHHLGSWAAFSGVSRAGMGNSRP